MNSSLREVLERLGPIQDVYRHSSGSKELAVLLMREGETSKTLKTVSCMKELVACGLSIAKARRAVETAMSGGRAELVLHKVPCREALMAEMTRTGFDLRITTPPESVDIKAVREKLAMTQEQFCAAYGLEPRTIQNYEAGTRRPDTATLSYLDLIRRAPEQVRAIREGESA